MTLKVPDCVLYSHPVDLLINVRTERKLNRVYVLVVDFRNVEFVSQNILINHFESHRELRLKIKLPPYVEMTC